ncbi:hypothetical protein K443DRAFT_135317 [Laccaria amethystina LaAM-08-1]|uniref:Uncharacterized protein n=1 Tax=Laccaria amethystina LaAM-08-1 TaxID=1095629 RepID=A0A0C9WI50_9AGAR|nr:hypothetical protein K443DRAFT_135317 [Laccaria amethystina LaAM-08-1]
MDILFTDELGNVPSAEFRTIGQTDWIALNGSASAIPVEAMEYRSNVRRDQRSKGPTGVYLEMEWALDLDWYDHNSSWRPYIPLKLDDLCEPAVSKSGHDWFFDFEMSTPWEELSTGVFIVPEDTRATIDGDLLNLTGCIDEITSNHPFPSNSARPPRYDMGLLLRAFDSSEELQVAGCAARRTAVDYLGFLSWWTSSISGWDTELDHHIVAYLKEIQLDRFRKRGVLVDLERDWRHINISNFVRHRVPVAYPWSSSLAVSPRFTILSRIVLQVYDEQRQAAEEELLSSALQGLDNEVATMLRFDHFFQDVGADGRPDPDMEFNDDWRYYVVDFQGWSRRSVPLCVAKEYYVRFGSAIGHEDGSTMVLFRRWEPMDNVTTSPQAAQPMSMDGSTSMVRGSLEIRELHRSKHAPELGSPFDWNGQSTSRREPFQILSRPLRSRNFQSRNNSSSNSRRWLAQMSTMNNSSEESSLIEFRPSPSHSPRRNRSASPRPHTYRQRRGASPILRRQAVETLQEVGAVITYDGSVWNAPPGLEWNVTFYHESVILFPDARTLTRLRYWAITNPEISHMRHLLDLAIARNMRFVMATKIGDLKSFKPAVTSDLAELTKRTYEAGFQEEHLKDFNGGASFRDQYSIWALISMGGPTAWIAKRYGGQAIIQRFMDGPSTQVTVHHRGAVASSVFFEDPLFHDQISAQEENLVHGYVPAENPEHQRWLFPTTDIMEDFCDHWRGEWTEGCDSIFHHIAKSLDRGTAKPLTRKGWRSYLHSTNHGARGPPVYLTPAHFTKVDDLLLAFSDPWHGKRIADISFPVSFDSLSGN